MTLSASILIGEHTVGLYSLLQDETCWVLAVNFDKKTWQQDAAAFLTARRELDVPAALDVVSKLVDDNDNYIQQVNELHKALIDGRRTKDDAFEKAYADARKAADAIQAQKKKLEDDCNKLDDTLRRTITDMQKQAIKASQDKVADALGGFLKTL